VRRNTCLIQESVSVENQRYIYKYIQLYKYDPREIQVWRASWLMADGSMAPLRNRMVPWPTELTCQGALALLRSRRQKPAILRVPSTAHSPIQNKTFPFSSRHSSPPHDPGHSNEAASHVQVCSMYFSEIMPGSSVCLD
jgi:hypothetical protein